MLRSLRSSETAAKCEGEAQKLVGNQPEPESWEDFTNERWMEREKDTVPQILVLLLLLLLYRSTSCNYARQLPFASRHDVQQ